MTRRLADGTVIDDWKPKPVAPAAVPVDPGLSVLAGLTQLQEVLDSLPNSRAELEMIVAQARGVLAEVDARVDLSRATLAAQLSAIEGDSSRTRSEADAAAEQLAVLAERVASAEMALADTLSGRLAELDVWLIEATEQLTSPDSSEAIDRVRVETIETVRAELAERVDGLRVEYEAALETLRRDLIRRLQGIAAAGGGGGGTLRVLLDGVFAGSSETLDLVEGANISLSTVDSPGKVTVTIASAGGGGGSAHTIKEDGTGLTARAGLNFGAGLTATDDAGNDETDVVVDTSYIDTQVATTAVLKSLFDAHTVLKADSDNTPAALTMGASTILARLAAGNIVAATPAELRTLLALVIGTNVQAWDADLDTLAANNGGTTTWLAALLDGTYASLANRTKMLTFVVPGNGAAPTTGVKPSSAIRVPWACTVVAWHLYSDASGSIVLDVLKDTHGNFPPTDADRIAGTDKPTLSSAQKATSAALTGWTTALAEDDVLVVEVESAATLTQVTLAVEVTVP